MSGDSPYERVTNPERFAPLHEAAHELIADLRKRFDVEVTAVAPETSDLTGGVLETLRVIPRGSGAPVTITFTGFPGLHVRFGAEHTEAFPPCGCDACDEQPGQLAESLREKIECVAQGRFSERPGCYQFVFEDGRETSGQAVRNLGDRSVLRAHEPWPQLPGG